MTKLDILKSFNSAFKHIQGRNIKIYVISPDVISMRADGPKIPPFKNKVLALQASHSGNVNYIRLDYKPNTLITLFGEALNFKVLAANFLKKLAKEEITLAKFNKLVEQKRKPIDSELKSIGTLIARWIDQKRGEYSSTLAQQIMEAGSKLDNNFKRAPSLLFRSIRVSEKQLAALKKGKPLKLRVKPISSWTTSQRLAKQFAVQTMDAFKNVEDINVIIARRVQAGAVVVNVLELAKLLKNSSVDLDYSTAKGEREVIVDNKKANLTHLNPKDVLLAGYDRNWENLNAFHFW